MIVIIPAVNSCVLINTKFGSICWNIHFSSFFSDSPVSSGSDSERVHSSTKRKKKSEHASSSKHKKQKSKSPTHDGSELNNEQTIVQSKSPKRTIVVSRSNEKSTVSS